MRGALAWILGGACLTTFSAGSSEAVGAQSHSYIVGHKGWSLEHFGDDIAVLRAEISTGSENLGSNGLLLVSCQGRERRMRLSLPDPVEGAPPNAGGTILMDTYGGSAESRLFVVARTLITQGRHLDLLSPNKLSSSSVERFFRLILFSGGPIQVLLNLEGEPRRLLVHRRFIFSFKFTQTERRAVEQMAAACSTS